MNEEEARRILAAGPQPRDTKGRRVAVEQIVSRLESTHGNSIVAIGLYGSAGRDADRQYSDVELFCVVSNRGEERRWEWTDGSGKYEVEVFGEEVATRKAAELNEAWAITHAKYASPKALRGEPALFAELRRLVFDHPEGQFREVIRDVIVAELFEGLGKVRNATASGKYEQLPRVAMRMALMAELMVGLAHRHVYTASSLATAESIQLAPRPSGHDELCTMVQRGELNEPVRTCEVIERYWKSVIEWAVSERIELAPACTWPI